jgi:hypothetical protein
LTSIWVYGAGPSTLKLSHSARKKLLKLPNLFDLGSGWKPFNHSKSIWNAFLASKIFVSNPEKESLNSSLSIRQIDAYFSKKHGFPMLLSRLRVLSFYNQFSNLIDRFVGFASVLI